MTDFAICVDRLSKQYVIGEEDKGYQTLREALSSSFLAPFRRFRRLRGDVAEEQQFWALRDLTFEIKPGEVVGIIGSNGAGKSTLLKILSRITAPTEGRVEIQGRVASLLEVGTGFHPELTGRENIYLNGAILGMTRREIGRRFDEIVAFAEVEKFLDTPIKRFSSGMYVRLAFAVAAHLDPEILLVDEVLAVGDTAFQKKCLSKMEDTASAGRTVLFVSHNLGSIRALCNQAILLADGRLAAYGPVAPTIRQYVGEGSTNVPCYLPFRPKSGPYFSRVTASQSGGASGIFAIDKAIEISFEFKRRGRRNLAVGIVILNAEGVWVHHSSDEFAESEVDNHSSERHCLIPPYALAAGKYAVDVFLYERNIEIFEEIRAALNFEVHLTGPLSERSTGAWKGICGPGLLSWFSSPHDSQVSERVGTKGKVVRSAPGV